MPMKSMKTMMAQSRSFGESMRGLKNSTTCCGIWAMVMKKPTAEAVATMNMTTAVVLAAEALTRMSWRRESSR